MRAIRRLRHALVIPVLALLPLAGCFDTAKPSELSCTQSKYCPDGYVCVGAQTGSPGKCQKGSDGGGADTSSIADGATATDLRSPDTVALLDGHVPPSDGPQSVVETSVVLDQAPSVDTSTSPDAVPDVAGVLDLSPDSDLDAPLLLDVAADSTATLLDVGPDKGPDSPVTKPRGATCTQGNDCADGFCVDSVCCNTACAGQCQVCSSAGICVRNPSGAPSGGRTGCSGSGSCVGTCDGSSESCVYPGTTTTCGITTCSADLISVNTPACNGQGSCSTTTLSNCGSSSYCNAGACASKIANGSSCQDGVQCSSGNCSNDAATGASICCKSNYSNCGSCVDMQNSSSNCGSCGNTCGNNRSCQVGFCKCAGYAFPSSCGSGCGAWSFESGTAEGWVKDTNPLMPVNGGARNGVTNVLVSQTHHDGSYALAFPALIDVTNTYNASVTVPICPGSTINLSGYTMSAWIYVTGTGLGSDTFLFFDAWGPSGMISSSALMGDKLNTLNTWQQATITFSSSVDADHVSIRLNDPPGWTGTIYVDSVTITPP